MDVGGGLKIGTGVNLILVIHNLIIQKLIITLPFPVRREEARFEVYFDPRGQATLNVVGNPIGRNSNLSR